MKREYTVRNVRPLAHQRAVGSHVVGFTYTLDEALAVVRHFVEDGAHWTQFEIEHTDGRRWFWELAGPNVTLKVDTPARA